MLSMNGRSCLLNELMMSSTVFTDYTHVMCVGGGAEIVAEL